MMRWDEALGKDYAKETEKTHKLIQKYCQSGGVNLLDVACGTGTHAGYLSKYYKVEGMDIDPNMSACQEETREDLPLPRQHD
ncbi:MAG: class I SAM-dependent methyltransferase [Anaerolineales bacterium]